MFALWRRGTRRTLSVALVAALVVAALLRFTGLGFGAGALNARPDEELIRSATLLSFGGDLNPHYAVWGHLFHYLYLLVGAAALGLEVLAGAHASWADAVAAAHMAPARFATLGRAISAVAGTLTVLATYQLALRSTLSRTAATASAILLATLFLHVRDSHFATNDILLTLLSTTALAVLAREHADRPWRGGVWTGLALATKLLAVTVVLTQLSMSLIEQIGRPAAARMRLIRAVLVFGSVAASVAVGLQPFLFLDPMETYFGLFGDLFNPERRPFEQGLYGANVSIIVRYYVPHGLGWLVAGLALAGAIHLTVRGRVSARWLLILYAVWNLVALVSVQRIFLRYLDPVLPIVSIFAAHALVSLVRRVAPRRRVVVVCLAAAGAISLPGLWRDLWLVDRLRTPDTRTLAGEWIESNVESGATILWAGFGHTPPHITMPRLSTPDGHDQEFIARRAARELPTAVEEACRRWKDERQVPRYSLIAVSFADPKPDESVFETFPMIDRHYDIPLLERVADWSRARGWLTLESPRVDLVHRHVTGVANIALDQIGLRTEPYLVVTGLPIDPAVLAAVERTFTEVHRISPGPRARELYERGWYDQGDAWFLPNIGIRHVDRPGVEIRIFRRSP